MCAAGFDAIDFYFNFSEEYYNDDTDSVLFQERFVNLRKLAEDKGMSFTQAHAPFPSSFTSTEKTEERFKGIVRSLRNASYLGIDKIVVHPMLHLNYLDRGIPERLFELNMEFYNRLLPYCEDYNIKVALENLWYRPSGKRIYHSACSRPDEFIRYLDTLNSQWFTGCLDLGHACLVCENPADFIRALGRERLAALHVHDVDGVNDTHTLPYYGVIDWKEVMLALKEIGYTGDFTFEVSGDYLKALPKEVVPYALQTLAQTGRHLMKML